MLKIVSWNLYYRMGAAAADISAIIERETPDLFVMQEATSHIEALPSLVEGQFHKLHWHGKSYGLGAWVPDGRTDIRLRPLSLPYSNLPGKFPPRLAQLIETDGMTIANVHLSHGQLLNRRQLRTIAAAVEGPLAIIGDFNALGTIMLRGFTDVGPRQTTHHFQKMVPLRLDRCLVRGLKCLNSEVLDYGRSDHRPIVLDLAPH